MSTKTLAYNTFLCNGKAWIYKGAQTFEGCGDFKLNMAADPNCGFNSLYVYCDAPEAITVGDTKAPILLVVDWKGELWRPDSQIVCNAAVCAYCQEGISH